MWPGPITGEGTTHENLDINLSLASLEQSLTMQRSLNIKPETEPGTTKDKIKEKLMNHPQKDYWHCLQSLPMAFRPCHHFDLTQLHDDEKMYLFLCLGQ